MRMRSAPGNRNSFTVDGQDRFEQFELRNVYHNQDWAFQTGAINRGTQTSSSAIVELSSSMLSVYWNTRHVAAFSFRMTGVLNQLQAGTNDAFLVDIDQLGLEVILEDGSTRPAIPTVHGDLTSVIRLTR